MGLVLTVKKVSIQNRIEKRIRNDTRVRVVLGIFLVLATSLAKAQTYTDQLQKLCLPEVRSFTIQDYQAQRQNWSISQSKNTRFIYVGNSKGLLEYDGQTWKNFILPHRQIIRSVATAGERIYTGALQEFGYWQANSKGVLTYHSLNSLNKDPRFKQEEIWNIITLGEAVYFHSFAYLFRYQHNQITTLPTPGNVFFAYQVDNRLFVQIMDKGIYEWVDEQFVYLPGSDRLAHERVRCVFRSGPNQLQIGTDRMLFTFDGKGFTILNTPASRFLADNQLNKAIRVDERTYAYGSVQNGLIITDEWGRIRYHLNQKSGLQNNTVLALHADADKNVWVGTDNGIDAVLLSSPVRHFRDKDGVLGSVYDATLYQGKLYVGTNHGVFQVNEMGGKTRLQLVPGSQGQVWDLEVIDGTLFCGHNEGTFVLEGSGFRQISELTGGLVLYKLQKHPDLLIQGTYTDLALYQQVNGRWQLSHSLAGDFSLTDQIIEQDAGTLLLRRKYRGITQIRLADNLRTIQHTTPLNGLQGANLIRVQEKPLVCTDQQSYFLEGTTLKAIPALGKQGVRNIFPINSQDYLVLRSNGTLAYWRENQSLRPLNIKHVQWVEGYENVVRLDDQTLLICGDDGFSVVPVSYLRQGITETQAHPLIRQISTEEFDQTLYPGQPQPELQFRYWQNNLTIDFTSTQYEADVTYEYWLEGKMPGWTTLSNTHTLTTGPLDPGTYVLHLRSSVSSEETTLSFDIRPPWYWNRWSQFLYLVLLVVSVWLAYQFYRRRIRMHQSRIQRKMQVQLEEEQLRNAQVLAELRNEQLRKDVERKSEELANSAMNLLQKNELLETIKGELEKLRKEIGPETAATQYRSLVQLINRNLADEHSWDIFESNFNDVHDYFFKKLLESFPNLTPGDLKLAAYLRMNLSSKEIAQLLNITVRSVELKRYRLRTKLNLQTEQNLNEFLIKL